MEKADGQQTLTVRLLLLYAESAGHGLNLVTFCIAVLPSGFLHATVCCR